MDNAICPECNGTGKPFAVIVIGEVKYDQCSLCEGSGIATDDEASEFHEHMNHLEMEDE